MLEAIEGGELPRSRCQGPFGAEVRGGRVVKLRRKGERGVGRRCEFRSGVVKKEAVEPLGRPLVALRGLFGSGDVRRQPCHVAGAWGHGRRCGRRDGGQDWISVDPWLSPSIFCVAGSVDVGLAVGWTEVPLFSKGQRCTVDPGAWSGLLWVVDEVGKEGGGVGLEGLGLGLGLAAVRKMGM